MSSSTSAARECRPAATVLVLRDAAGGPEVFMVRRHEASAFMGGAYVFPGGRVDPADRNVADESWCAGIDRTVARLASLAPADALAHAIAAARELFEEAGVLLARGADGRFVSLAGAELQAHFAGYRALVHAGAKTLREVIERERLRLALDALVPFAHWVTPPVDVRRFDTWFFITRVPPDQSPVHDARETVDGVWLHPSDAIARSRRGEIVLPPPTWTTVRELEPFESVEAAIAWAAARPIGRREPLYVERDGRRMLLLPGDPLNPEPAVGDVPRETRFVYIDGQWRAE